MTNLAERTLTIDQLSFAAVPASFVDEVRAARMDDAGRRPRELTDLEGGSPLRCCLRYSTPGEELLLLSYAPLRHRPRDERFDPGPYDEMGPVYVHARDCGGYSETGRYPAAFTVTPQVFRCYGWDGRIVGGRVVEPEEDHDSAAAELIADDAVAFIQTHNVVYGCYMVEISRSAG
jgi:hypothetical protein